MSLVRLAGSILMRIILVFFLTLLSPIAYAASDLSPVNWEEEIAAFETADRTNPPPANSVVFVGSSSIRFWSSLAADFAPISVVNRGFGGSQITDATAFIDRIVLRYKPKAVVFYSGDNDIASGKSPQIVLRDFTEFVSRIRIARPDLPIILISVKPSPSRWALKEQVVTANKLLREFCLQTPNVDYVDIFTPMLNESGEPQPDLFRQDKLHMNAKGYEIWTSYVKPVLQKVLSKN